MKTVRFPRRQNKEMFFFTIKNKERDCSAEIYGKVSPKTLIFSLKRLYAFLETMVRFSLIRAFFPVSARK